MANEEKEQIKEIEKEIDVDIEKTSLKETAAKTGTRGTSDEGGEDPLKLALTVQAALKTDRRGKQETESEQGLLAGTNDGVNVLMESGDLSCEYIEHIIHGKNGFEFPIKRIYDTCTAKSDCPSMVEFIRPLKTNKPDTAWLLNTMGYNINILKVSEEQRMDPKINTDKVKEEVRKMGGNMLCLGAGWRLGLPYVDKYEVLHLPEGGQFIADDMTATTYTPYKSGYDKCEAYEKHGGGKDFIFIITRSVTERDSRGAPTAWKIEFCQLIEKNGLTYIFNEDGNVTKITDPSGTNVITVSYSNGLINEITEPFGSKMKFTYVTMDKYVCPVIKKISLLNAAGIQTSTLEYTYKSLSGERKALNLLPLLQKAKDKGGRITNYEYQKCTGIYAFYDSSLEESYLNSIMYHLNQYSPNYGSYTTVTGLETPELLSKLTTPYGFIQTVTYSKKTATIISSEAGSYIPTKKERIMVTSVTDKNGSLSKSRSYSYTQKLHANSQIYVSSVSMQENSRYSVFNYTEKKDGDRYIPHISSKSLSIPLDKSTDIVVSRTNYTWDSNNRLSKEKTTTGKNSSETSYSYDNWGNVTTETIIKKNNENASNEKTATRTTKSKYFNTSSANITGFPNGVPSTSAQNVKGTRGLLISCEITDTVDGIGTICKKQMGYSYDSYGRCIWEGIWNQNIWERNAYNYNTVDSSNSWNSGLFMNKTTCSGQIYNYNYSKNGNELTETVSALNVITKDDNSNTTINTVTVTDMQTGLVKSFKDGKGNITTYAYDSLGRKTTTTTPDGVTEQTLYDDLDRIVTLRIKKAGTSSYSNRNKYEYDTKGNLIKKEQYNSVGTGDGNYSCITESYTYNSDDKQLTFTDGKANVISYVYDPLGRVIEQTNPDGTKNKREYNDTNNIIYVTDEDGHNYKEYLNFDGQTVGIEKYIGHPGGYERIISVSEYDASGRLVRTNDGIGYNIVTCFSPFEKPAKQMNDAIIIREGENNKTVYPRKEYEYTCDGLVKVEYDGYVMDRTAAIDNTIHKLRTKRYTYNKIGWPLSIEVGFQENETISADKRKNDYEYDLNGNVTKEKHEDGTFKSYAYDSMNRVVSEIDECDNTTVFEYNHEGKLTKKTDSNGFVSEYIYDDFNRLVRAELPPVPGKTGKDIIRIKYDQNGNVTEITEGDGRITARTYDKSNRITSETVRKGSGSNEVKTVRGWKYNGNGSVAQEIQGGTPDVTNTAKTLYEYDVIGRLNKKTFSNGSTETYNYDHNYRIVQITYADGSSKKTEYNGLGFITKETDEEDFVTEYEYDVWGSEVYRKVKTSANGTEVRNWKTEYTVFGEVKSEESGDGRKWNYEYSNRGFLTKKTDPKGIVQAMGYDGYGRMISDIKTLGSVSLSRSIVYDPMGFIKSGTEGGITTAFNLSGSTYTANAYGLVTGCKVTEGSKTFDSTFRYDDGKRLKETVYPDSAKVVFGYNGIGQLVSVGNESSMTAYANNGIYDTAGHLTSMKGGNSLTRTENWNNTKGILDSYSWGISGKANNTLTWNNRGNITAQTKNGISYSYLYDKKDQLEEEKKAETRTALWTYDANGNRATEKNGNTVKTLVYYNKSDLVKSDLKWKYNYDNNGNMTYKGITVTSKTDGGLFEGWTFSANYGEVWSYEYDLCNRLTKVKYSKAGTRKLTKVIEYKYDFRNLMICWTTGSGSSAVSEYFAYDTEGKLIYTEKGSEKHDYVYANGKLWCEIVTSGNTKNTYYHHTDHLGTTVCITSSNGTELWNCQKNSFGEVISKKDSSFIPNFTGKLLDLKTGLYYFNARWYDPSMGRFIMEDPARDGKNWYVYCRNNPLIYIDAKGNAAILQRTINDNEANKAYHLAHLIGEKTEMSFVLHGLIDKGELGGFKESNSVWQYSGKLSGFTTNDSGSKTDEYIIRYSGMDDLLTEKAVNNVLQLERFGGGDNTRAKQKYSIFKNDCNDFTKEVFNEYRKEWKSLYISNNPKMTERQVNKAWNKHKKEITVDRGKTYNAKTGDIESYNKNDGGKK